MLHEHMLATACKVAICSWLVMWANSSALAVPTARQRNGPKLDTKTAQQLVAQNATRTAVLNVLTTLSKKGLLKGFEDTTNESSIKRQLTKASTEHSNTHTPYGPLVQSMDIGVTTKDMKKWEFLNPFAFLYHMCSISPCFADIMRSVCIDGQPLRIVIFADGLVPGNPYRPEKSRSLMCIYWAIADWPAWLLQRSFAWPIFSILRESIIETIPGGLGFLMRKILYLFFWRYRQFVH